MTYSHSSTRDIICLGASTGGIQAVRQLLGALPADFPASVFVVLHQAEVSGTQLAHILGAHCRLAVVDALHGEPIQRGKVYIAPADNHLLVRDGFVEVVRLPRENGHRPAVNPLFRSAAEAYGQRVVAVVLTGALDCGTAGLLVVKAHGGISIAQDPSTATCGDMPTNAIKAGVVDHIASLDGIAALLENVIRQESLPPAPSSTLAMLSSLSSVTCPNCHGSLKETSVGDVTEFECHVGHRFSLRSLYAEQADQVEFAMWAAIRALEESAALAERVSNTSIAALRLRLLDKQRTLMLHADTLREMVLSGKQNTRQDVSEQHQP